MRHRLTRVLPYTPEQLFLLVGDVERYPQFVPWITAMRVWNRREVEPGVTALDAEAGVGFSFLRERFSTRVVRNANSHEIAVSLISGPFRKLENRWSFSAHPEGCLIAFDIDFQFKIGLLDRMLAANFDQAVNKLISCFDDRARQLYDQPAG